MPYQWLLFDADNTLFDYEGAEENALLAAFAAAQIPFQSRYGEAYREINQGLWVLFEQRKIELADLRVRRFADLFERTGLKFDPQQFSQLYLDYLGQEIDMVPGAKAVLDTVHETHRLALITNGISQVQRSRLQLSGLEKYFSAIFISEEIGASKPAGAYFDAVFNGIGNPPKEDALIIGDSLSSDIRGGNLYGVDTCWFNPTGMDLKDGLTVTYEIDRLPALLEILQAS